MTNVRIILVPIDFSEGSLAAVRHARDLAEVFKCHIHLLHVSQATDAPRWAREVFGAQLRPLEEQDRLEALDRLATLIVVEGLDPMRTTGLVRTGCAEDVIAEYAGEVHADLIVMGLHGDRFIPDLRVGRVVERVLGDVHCPVLTVPDVHMPVARLYSGAADPDSIAC